MRKILFASTALVAAGLLTTGSADASDKINLQLGGFSKWWVVGAWNSNTFQSTGNATLGTRTAPATGGVSYDNVAVKGDNEVWFGGNTKLDNGLKVGVDIHLEAGGHTDATTDTIDKSYIYVEGGFGKFLVGTQKNGTYLLHVTAPDAAGNWNEGGIMSGGYAIKVPTNVNMMAGGNTTAINTTNNAEAITYVAPTFYGLTVGGSFLPHGSAEDQRGVYDLKTVSTTATQAGDLKEVYGVGALYANTFGGVGVKVSGGAITAQTSGDLTAGWFEQAYGTQLSYAGFTLGGSFRQQKANYTKGRATDLGTLGDITSVPGSLGNGKAFDVGLSYATGPYAVSFTYFNSAVTHNYNTAGVQGGKDAVNLYQISGKYNLGPGVDLLSSAGYADFKSALGNAQPGDSNSGWTVMSGVSLTF